MSHLDQPTLPKRKMLVARTTRQQHSSTEQGARQNVGRHWARASGVPFSSAAFACSSARLCSVWFVRQRPPADFGRIFQWIIANARRSRNNRPCNSDAGCLPKGFVLSNARVANPLEAITERPSNWPSKRYGRVRFRRWMLTKISGLSNARAANPLEAITERPSIWCSNRYRGVRSRRFGLPKRCVLSHARLTNGIEVPTRLPSHPS